VTFYFDASIQVRVALTIAEFRNDVLYAGGPGAPAQSTPDVQWLARAGDRDWVVLTRDKRIRTRPGERQTFLDAGVRCFCFTQAGNATSWEMLQVVVSMWDRIEGMAARSGPYICSVTRSRGVRWLAP
jgi:hypothetical protein